MKFIQHKIELRPRSRGFHLITQEVSTAVPEINEFVTGMCQVFIQHTSASLTINENADHTVRKDFETWVNAAVPENLKGFQHNSEGSDDMPAHIKSSLFGSSILIPVRNGKFALGIWQGIYLCEHRDDGGKRSLIITLWGE